MVEKFWLPVGPVSFTAPGTALGVVTIQSTHGFKVKMKVRVDGTSLPGLALEVKRVNSPTVMELGPIGGKITDRIDLSAYLTGSTVTARLQPRNDIPLQELARASYDEEPTVAWRSISVDQYGQYYTTDNPFPVQLSNGSINIESLQANLSVQLTAKDNDPTAGDIHDSVRIGDGTNELHVNADGSLDVNVIHSTDVPTEVISQFDEAFSVPASSLTLISTYTVPAGKTGALQRIDAGGENIATYTVYLNGTLIAKRRTYFSGGLETTFEFTGFSQNGLLLNAADQVTVKVIHSRPDLADFASRIQVLQLG